jgi:hypothetical protein
VPSLALSPAAQAAQSGPARARLVLDAVNALVSPAAVNLSWLAPDGRLEVLAVEGFPHAAAQTGRRFEVRAPTPLAEAFRTGERIWMSSADAIGARYPLLGPLARTLGHGAWGAFPLASGGVKRGAILLAFPEGHPAPPRDQLGAVADAVAAVLSSGEPAAQRR